MGGSKPLGYDFSHDSDIQGDVGASFLSATHSPVKNGEGTYLRDTDDEAERAPSEAVVGHRLQASRSVLSLAIDEDCVYAGLQGGEILAWSLETCKLVLSVQAHEESVLGLFLSEDRRLLISCGGDSIVNVWTTENFKRIYSINSLHDVGDIFAVVYSTELKTVYCGSQNTSLQWCDLGCEISIKRLESQPSKGAHRFFDSKGPGGLPSLDAADTDSDYDLESNTSHHGGRVLSFKKEHHLLYAHHGYIYCMLLVRGFAEQGPHANSEILLTGSGDGTVKMWHLENSFVDGMKMIIPVEAGCLQNGYNSVLSLAVDGPFMYCGLANGSVNIWNLESKQIIRRLNDHPGDVWALDIINGMMISGGASGVVKGFNSRFEEVNSWVSHEGVTLSSASGMSKGRHIYATGGNDNTVAIWDLTNLHTEQQGVRDISNDEMVNALAKIVAYRTTPSRPAFAGECNKGAAFLRRHCAYLGAQTKLLVTGPDTNPIVYARFNASNSDSTVPSKTVLFYGHYDVVIADIDRRKRWNTDPFTLTSLDGFLYGRGVSDNKGPVLAALYAAAELSEQRSLGCNIVFLIEGEEESGSQGFAETVEKHRDLIGDVDWILLANSYWLDDKVPCLTYGLRGVVHANLIVSGPYPDLHSGIDGSALLDEPLKDLTMLLSTLIGKKGTINLPGFYDPVLPLTDVEKRRYDDIANTLLEHHPVLLDNVGSNGVEAFTDSLMHRWREPSLTIHSIDIPSPLHASGTTIARKAQATLSIRIVPNQDPETVSTQLITFVQSRFAELDSQNDLTVEITGTAEAWLGDPEDEIFCVLERAVTEVWGESNRKATTKHDFPPLPSRRRGLRTELMRTDSHDSIRSQSTPIKRVVASSSFRKDSVKRNGDVPTSSTLVHRPSSHARFTTVESGSSSRSETPAASSESTEPSQEQAAAATSTNKPSIPGKPLYIREGGSIPTIRLLEKMFDAPAAHLPCGQASDHAHLDNERMRVENLYQSREIFKRIFGPEGLVRGKRAPK
ncbi:hypothetical protein KEM56_001095 [Ascosphaera pollenicola]|nr:hypothetical protein KEM56_001095 [Ascosphaera pollenicola]